MRQSNVIVIGCGVLMSISAGVYWYFCKKLKVAIEKIIDVENIPETADGAHVILDGIVSVSKGILDKLKRPDKSIILITETTDINRRLGEILPKKYTYKKRNAKFYMGTNSNVHVKLTDTKLIVLPLIEESWVQVDMTWWNTIKSFFSSKVSCFKRERTISLEHNKHLYAEGVLKSIGKSEYEIEPTGIFTYKNDFLSKFTTKKNISEVIFVLSLMIFTTSCIALYYYRYMPKNALKKGRKCLLCDNTANVILNECNHMVICRACLISQTKCPEINCNRFIRTYTTIIT
ncbi:hypothetical protein SteCoe_20367 [Stentor coeruleus]|uniref:RING-type domain-containing protein n=1 Tax=Stentor coeruleus TaxID=5963 RepID=A0A1R2BSG0_9CILI|nr:hypothetical protein SteCoe_20367 [Stentor coeruleus]